MKKEIYGLVSIESFLDQIENRPSSFPFHHCIRPSLSIIAPILSRTIPLLSSTRLFLIPYDYNFRPSPFLSLAIRLFQVYIPLTLYDVFSLPFRPSSRVYFGRPHPLLFRFILGPHILVSYSPSASGFSFRHWLPPGVICPSSSSLVFCASNKLRMEDWGSMAYVNGCGLA